jgi:NADPH2:quinone reductase
MKAAVYYQNGGPEVFRFEDYSDPVIGPDQILLRVKCISIEGGDLFTRENRPLPRVPNILGYQCAGEIIGLGAAVKNKRIGQRVVAVTRAGSYAELVAAEDLRTFVLPDELSYEQGAIVPTAFFTANECLFTFGHLRHGQSVLIHGGTGAVGQAAIQLAKRAGAVIYTTGSDDLNLRKLKLIGADHVINYSSTAFDKEVLQLTSGCGVDLIIDSVGGNNLAKSLNALAYKGIIVFIGFTGHDKSMFDPKLLWSKNATLTGVYAPCSTDSEPERFRETIAQMLTEVALKKFEVRIAKVFPLSEAREAHQYIADKKAFGRVLLIP